MNRRRVLRGLGGLAVGLPFLEYFAPRQALAAPPPQRYCFMFAGFSIGSYGNDKMAPKVAGPLAANITRGIKPLETYGVADVVSMVSGLNIPVGNTAPAAGRPPAFHSSSHQVLATGMRYEGEGGLPGISSDWVVADAIGQGTLQQVLAYRAQPSFYRVDSDGGGDGIISKRKNSEGELEAVEPLVSPRVAYESLFSGFVPPEGTENADAKKLLAMRKSVVDLVADDAGGLITRLGKADKLRMQRHFDELREMEKRLDALDLPGAAGCSLLAHPGDDPAVGDAIDPGGGDYNSYYENANGYSNEKLRAEIMCDLIHMAYACDISRVSSFMLTFAQCFMNMYTPLGLASDLHEITHGSVGDNEDEMQDALADCAAFHVEHFARLTQKLRDTEDVDGSSLLDNTALVLAFEGGWGYDLEADVDFSPHSTENMVMLVGGKAGGLNQTPGRHIVKQGTHPCAVINTVIKAVGVDATMGEVSETVDELIG
jgi:hypothetical protein